MLGISTAAALLYFVAFAYIVATASKVFTQGSSRNSPFLAFLEGLLELLSTISKNQFSFFFAIVMNFILLYGIFCLNMCSLYLVELAKSLE
jgi:hypothetical protein